MATTPAVNGGPPQRAAIEQGYLDAYEAEGFLNDDGAIDRTRLRETIYGVLAPRKVLNWRERDEKAMTRGSIVRAIFPSLTPPEQFAEAANPALAEAVWDKILQAIGSELRPSAGGPMQRLVGLNMGNGYVLVRAQVGADRVTAFYITDDRDCIVRDYLAADNLALKRKLAAVEANVEMLMTRQPDNARAYMRGHERHLRAISASGHARLTLALEAATEVDDATAADDAEVADDQAAAS